MYRKIIEKLTEWKENDERQPLIIKGARQVGKTYILREWGARSFHRVHEINFEKNPKAARVFEADFEIKRIIDDIGLLLNTSIDPKNDLLILDEIQAAPKALTSLKYFCEDLPELAVCAAGSLLGVILADESFPVGKVEFLHLHPMNFIEFLMAVDEKESWKRIPDPSVEALISSTLHDHLWEMVKLYYAVGGMPAAVKAYAKLKSSKKEAFREVRKIQRNLVAGYESDFSKHAGKLNATHIQALYRNIPSQLESTHEDSTKRFQFSDILPGKKGFTVWERPLHWLINAGLVLQVKIANGTDLPIEHFCKPNMFKLFLHDIGLLGCLQGLEIKAILNQEYGLAKGFFAENFVAQQLRSSSEEYVWPLFSWQEGTSQIEFIRSYAGKVIPIEVKSGHRTKAKSLMQFNTRYDPPLAIKVSAQNLSYDHSIKLLNLPLYLAEWAALLE